VANIAAEREYWTLPTKLGLEIVELGPSGGSALSDGVLRGVHASGGGTLSKKIKRGYSVPFLPTSEG